MFYNALFMIGPAVAIAIFTGEMDKVSFYKHTLYIVHLHAHFGNQLVSWICLVCLEIKFIIIAFFYRGRSSSLGKRRFCLQGICFHCANHRLIYSFDCETNHVLCTIIPGCPLQWLAQSLISNSIWIVMFYGVSKTILSYFLLP